MRPVPVASCSGGAVLVMPWEALLRMAREPKQGTCFNRVQEARLRHMAPGLRTLGAQARVRGIAAKLLTLSPRVAPPARTAKHWRRGRSAGLRPTATIQSIGSGRPPTPPFAQSMLLIASCSDQPRMRWNCTEYQRAWMMRSAPCFTKNPWSRQLEMRDPMEILLSK